MNKEEAIKKNLEGLKLYQEEKYEEALRLFNEALEIDGEYLGALVNRTEVYKKLGREADADADREKWKSLMPVNIEATQPSREKSVLERLLDTIEEPMYSKIREQLCTELRSLGIDAQLSDPLRSIENIECGFNSESYGLISITESPIRWVNIIRQTKGSEGGTEIIYYIKYVVPDSKLRSDYPSVDIKSKRKGDKWQWRGKDSGLGIIDCKLTNFWLAYMKIQMVTIRNYSKRSLWIISSKLPDKRSITISEDSWNCYQAISNHLLSTWTH